MTAEKLPEIYKGFPTAGLLELWESIPYNTMDTPPSPVEEIVAMRMLVLEYELSDFAGKDGKEDPKKIRRSKQLLAPFGIDVAPWADENGMMQEELLLAWYKDIAAEEALRPKYEEGFDEDEDE